MVAVPDATVTVGVQPDYTRLAFRFAGPTTVTPLQQGSRLDLRFSRAADIDIAELRASPPRFVREIRRVSAVGAPVRLQLTLDAGVRQRHFVDGDRVVLDLLPPEGGVEQTTAADGQRSNAPAPARPPVTGTGRVQLVENANDTRITVTWPAAARAAAFRRGEAIWLVFDASGRMDLSGVNRVGPRHQDIQIVQGQGIIGLRVPAPPEVQVSASADDNAWTFTLSARATPAQAAPLAREINADGRGRMTVRFGREGVVRWINDPEIGDRIAVAMLGGPARGVDTRRATLEAAILPAAHGAVVEPRADDVSATYTDGVLTVSRGEGLIAAAAPDQSQLAADVSAAMMADELGGAPIDQIERTQQKHCAQRHRQEHLADRPEERHTLQEAEK